MSKRHKHDEHQEWFNLGEKPINRICQTFTYWHLNNAVTQGPSDEQLLSKQNLMTQLTHLELLSPSQTETKEKTSILWFLWKLHTGALFFGYLWVSWQCRESYERESFRLVSSSGRECSDGAWGSGEVNGLSPQRNCLTFWEMCSFVLLPELGEKINTTLMSVR